MCVQGGVGAEFRGESPPLVGTEARAIAIDPVEIGVTSQEEAAIRTRQHGGILAQRRVRWIGILIEVRLELHRIEPRGERSHCAGIDHSKDSSSATSASGFSTCALCPAPAISTACAS